MDSYRKRVLCRFRQRLRAGWAVAGVIVLYFAFLGWGMWRLHASPPLPIFYGPIILGMVALLALCDRCLRCPVCDGNLELVPSASSCPYRHLSQQGQSSKETGAETALAVEGPQSSDDAWREPFRRRLRFVAWMGMLIALGIGVPATVIAVWMPALQPYSLLVFITYMHVWGVLSVLRVRCPSCGHHLRLPLVSRRCVRCGFWYSGAPLLPDPGESPSGA